MMIHVTTGSRLHFGLFRLPGQAPTPGTRQFGGVGLMVERPGLTVRVQPATAWAFQGPLQERARTLAAKAVQTCSIAGAFDICVESCPAEHVGLGTGTQLSLAIASALSLSCGSDIVRGTGFLARPSGEDGLGSPSHALKRSHAVNPSHTYDILGLARRLGRGQRSALGIHGFLHGGFLVEAGKGPSTTISPLVAGAEFPEDWRVLVIVPPGKSGCHGPPETQAFADLAQVEPSEHHCDVLCRLTLLGMLPAVQEADLPAFGESLYEFNRRVGEMFRPAQGGIYSQPLTEELVGFLRGQGVQGVGQSSWGPAVFAVTDTERAEHFAGLVRQRFGLREDEVIVTRARNHGARLLTS